MFKCNKNGSGYHIIFANGWTVSVQWGPATYSSNRNEPRSATFLQSNDAEVAAWDKNGKWWKFEMDTVQGYMSPDKVADFTAMIAKLPS